MTIDLGKLLDHMGLKISAKKGGTPPEDFKGSTAWHVTMTLGKKKYTTPFYTGSAIKTVKAADVISSLCQDATSAENARNFEEWAGDFGMDTDSRKAEAIYKACKATAPKLRAFLGSDYDRVCEAASEY